MRAVAPSEPGSKTHKLNQASRVGLGNSAIERFPVHSRRTLTRWTAEAALRESKARTRTTLRPGLSTATALHTFVPLVGRQRLPFARVSRKSTETRSPSGSLAVPRILRGLWRS